MFRLIGKFLKLILPLDAYLNIRSHFLNFQKKCSIKNIRSKVKKYYRFAIRYPKIYRKYSSRPIDENKVLFIEPSNLFSNNFQQIYYLLKDQYSFEIHVHLLRHFFVSDKEYERRCEDMLKDLATAKYVFIDEACDVFSRISLRKETIIAQTWHACGAFKKFGFSTAEKLFGPDRKALEKYPYYSKDTFVAVSSPEVVWAYAEAMGLPEEKILPIGVSRTDVFFDEDFKTAARRKLEYYMPNSVGKKVILFAPTFRGRVAKATTATAFSIERFYEGLSDDYVLIMKHHPHVKNLPEIPEKYQNFAVDFTNTMTIEELLCAADICISDYSSLVFEYSLFEKPMIFFDYDIDEYFDWRGFYYNYDELTTGPAFKTNREMIDYIKHIDELFDNQRVIDFKNKFMSACDGHSTERIMDKVFGTDLENHLKDPGEKLENIVEIYGGPKSISFETGDDKSREKLFAKYPEIKGKTLIAYFPRERIQKDPNTKPYVKWQSLFEDLDEQYIVLFCKMPTEYSPAKFQQKRFINVGELLSQEKLAVIADVIVTDCNYAAGIYGIQTKPTFLYLPDYKWFCADEDDYKTSVEQLCSYGLFCEDMGTLISAIEKTSIQKYQLQNLPLTVLEESYKGICTHFIEV